MPTKQELVKWMTEQREGLNFESKVGIIWEFWSKKDDLYKIEKELNQFFNQEKVNNIPEVANKIRGLETDLKNKNEELIKTDKLLNFKIAQLENQLENSKELLQKTIKEWTEKEQQKHQEYLQILENKEKDWESKLKEALKKPTMVDKETETDLSAKDIAKMEADLNDLNKQITTINQQKESLQKDLDKKNEEIKDLVKKLENAEKPKNHEEKELIKLIELDKMVLFEYSTKLLKWLDSGKRDENTTAFNTIREVSFLILQEINWGNLREGWEIVRQKQITYIKQLVLSHKRNNEMQKLKKEKQELETQLLLETKTKKEIAFELELEKGWWDKWIEEKNFTSFFIKKDKKNWWPKEEKGLIDTFYQYYTDNKSIMQSYSSYIFTFKINEEEWIWEENCTNNERGFKAFQSARSIFKLFYQCYRDQLKEERERERDEN